MRPHKSIMSLLGLPWLAVILGAEDAPCRLFLEACALAGGVMRQVGLGESDRVGLGRSDAVGLFILRFKGVEAAAVAQDLQPAPVAGHQPFPGLPVPRPLAHGTKS